MKQLLLLASEAVDVRRRLPTALRADASSAEPKWVQVFPFGTFHNGGWPEDGITVDAKYCATMVANWKRRGAPALPIDYLHRGGDSEDVADLPLEQKVAAGWMEDFEVRADGLYALTRWTPKARDLIKADEFRFVSPEWSEDGLDGRTGERQGPTLIGAGLVNRPAFKEMPRVAATAVIDPAAPKPVAPEEVMNRAQIDAMLKAAGINLAATATDAEAVAALSKHVSDNAAVKAKADAENEATLKAKQATEANEKALKAQLDEATTDKAKLGVRVAELEKAQKDTKVEALIARARSEGRITAAPALEAVKELANKVSIEAAEKMVDGFPKGASVDLTVKGHGNPGEAPAPSDFDALSAKYSTELDVLIAAGDSVVAATKKLNRKPEFAPLFKAVAPAKA